MIATLTSKGQITLPKSLREALGLVSGCKLDFMIAEGGGFTAQPVKVNALSVRGVLKSPHARPLSKAAEAKAVTAALARQYAKPAKP